jgi:hypothetical protein
MAKFLCSDRSSFRWGRGGAAAIVRPANSAFPLGAASVRACRRACFHDTLRIVMNDAPIQIRNPDVTRAIRALAEQKGQPITDVVAEAVNTELQRLEAGREAEVRRRLALIEDAVARFNALPAVGPLLTDDDLYDEDGFPR